MERTDQGCTKTVRLLTRAARDGRWWYPAGMKLYTKTGDDGSTGLFGGQRTGKDDPRVEAYGAVDELNAAIGLAISAIGDGAPERLIDIRAALLRIQSELFTLGADLATPMDSKHEGKIRRIGPDDATWMEPAIDGADAETPEISCFILPGGTELASRLHLARTICRRAERRAVAAGERINPHTIVHLNRLGDLLFALARLANHVGGCGDIPWRAGE